MFINIRNIIVICVQEFVTPNKQTNEQASERANEQTHERKKRRTNNKFHVDGGQKKIGINLDLIVVIVRI